MNDVDVLERARAGDQAAFEALVDLWGDTVFRLAWLLTGDRAQTASVVRRALLASWRDLPALHTERAFRPWLLATVIELGREHLGPAPGSLGPIEDLPEDARVAAALRFGIGLKLGEIAETMITSLRIARGSVAEALEALGHEEDEVLRAVADDLRGVELEGGFFDTALARHLERAPLATAARAVTTPLATVWRAACSPEGLGELCGFAVPPRAVRPGAHLRASGRLAGRWRARVDVIVTRAEPPSLLSWTVRARPLLRPGSVEVRQALTLHAEGRDTRLTLTLDGIAASEAFTRGYPDLAERLQPVLHRGLESLAARAASL